MIPYLVTFICSVASLHISDKAKNKKIKFLFGAIAILLPSALAGLRDYSIGTDVETYGNIWFKNACNANDYFGYIQHAMWDSIGIGYATLNYIVAMFTNNAHWFYFILSLIANLFIYFGLRRNKDICSIPDGSIVYYFVFYCIFLNALRQSVAVAIVFWGFYYIRNNNLIKYAFTVILASLFHTTALVALLMYAIHWTINKKNHNIRKVILIACLAVVSLEFWNVITFLSKHGMIPYRYGAYVDHSSSGGGVITRIIFYGLFYFVLCFFSRFSNHSPLENDFKIYNLISVLFSLLAVREAQSVRIVMYYDILLVYYFSYTLKSNLIVKKDKIGFKIIMIIFVLLYWIVVFGIRKSDQVVPYHFMR
mgnify:CR=1 FL=1